MKKLKVMMAGLQKSRILLGFETLEAQLSATLRKIVDYSKSNVIENVLRIIPSYTDYVNRVVWKKI